MKIQDFFDAGYYINLDKRDDRRKHITSVLNNIGLGDFVERIPAEDGTDELDVVTKHHFCAASHKKIYELALERNHERFVVFEDDFALYNTDDYSGIDNIEAGLDQLKDIDWDIIYFGGYIKDDEVTKVSDNLLKVSAVLTLHGYGISKSGLEKILRHRPFIDSALDGWVGNQTDMNKYMIYPMASYQTELSSDLDAWSTTPPLSHWEHDYLLPTTVIL
jgi:GR25 family glycosyltransferase involved in LPS biosynthesis